LEGSFHGRPDGVSDEIRCLGELLPEGRAPQTRGSAIWPSQGMSNDHRLAQQANLGSRTASKALMRAPKQTSRERKSRSGPVSRVLFSIALATEWRTFV